MSLIDPYRQQELSWRLHGQCLAAGNKELPKIRSADKLACGSGIEHCRPAESLELKPYMKPGLLNDIQP